MEGLGCQGAAARACWGPFEGFMNNFRKAFLGLCRTRGCSDDFQNFQGLGFRV